jgi:hypothetical protein
MLCVLPHPLILTPLLLSHPLILTFISASVQCHITSHIDFPSAERNLTTAFVYQYSILSGKLSEVPSLLVG